jgi:16S rRNA (guanine527-N7)-methyltransferase
MGKRVNFLRRVADDLKLRNAQILRHRLEDLHPTPHSQNPSFYTLVTARALAPLPQLIPLCAPLVAPGGYLLAMKGPKAAQELKDAEQSLYRTGLHLVSVEPLEIPGLRAIRACVILTRPAENVR